MEKIQQKFTISDSESQNSTPVVKGLHLLKPATEDDVQKLVIKSQSKSCSLDPLPTFLLKDCLEEILPAITAIINASLSAASVPAFLKKAVVTPLIKKATLDPDTLGNYHPVSNLSFVSKILEKVVSERLMAHKTSEVLFEPFQSAYRAGHSTETAVVRVQNDILEAIDDGKCVFLVLLDLSAAFDTVSHDILLERLNNDLGISGPALAWVQSYLTNRSQSVLVSGTYSEPALLQYGVPQGSVLGPGLFSDYSSPVASLIRSFGISAHCYADDTQLYVSFTPDKDEAVVRERLEDCIAELRVWMNRNRLKLNDQKTEFIIFGTSANLKRVRTTSVRVGDENISASDKVRNIGAMFDREMKMDTQVNSMCKSAWYHLFMIRKIRDYLTVDQTKSVIHAYVTSKLDNNRTLWHSCLEGLWIRITIVDSDNLLPVCKIRLEPLFSLSLDIQTAFKSFHDDFMINITVSKAALRSNITSNTHESLSRDRRRSFTILTIAVFSTMVFFVSRLQELIKLYLMIS